MMLLTGCVTPFPDLEDDSEDQWRARGKFSFQTADAKESGNFDWRQSGDQYQARLFGPLGFGTVQIEGDPDSATIRTSRGERHSSNPTQLAYEATGMLLPIDEFPNWLRDKSSAQQKPVDQKTVELAGWNVQYSNYEVSEDGERLPGRIVATQNDNQILLIIHDWQ